jgi:integrase
MRTATDQTTFGCVAREWWQKHMETRGAPRYAAQVWRCLEREALPDLGGLTLEEITPPIVLSVLRRVEARGSIEAAHKLRGHISQVMRYGIVCGMAHANPARDLGFALARQKSTPRAAITEPGPVGKLMMDIEKLPLGKIRSALKLAALTFVRPGELRQAAWSEINMDMAEWRIPAARMKMKRPHIVPLARQAMNVVRELAGMTGEGKYLFPMLRDVERPMTPQAVNRALRRMGYAADVMTGHGFRAMASSLLAEQNWSIDAIERQLAHAERNKVRAAYHRAEHLEERRRMMQAWADYLDMRCAWAVLGR